jgi:hypothetical protein
MAEREDGPSIDDLGDWKAKVEAGPVAAATDRPLRDAPRGR